VLGASKRLAEACCQALDAAGRGRGGTRYVTVRFGNVLGSAGSVVPLFQEQLAQGGPLTVTHPDMTRFFMTAREAVELVLQATAIGTAAEGPAAGALFVLDMGEPVRILDLARQMIRLSGRRPETDVAIVFTGLRPGEKMHEQLLHPRESLMATAVPGVLLAQPRVTVGWPLLRNGIEELAEAGQSGRAEQVLRVLGRLVPEYAPPDAAAPRAAASQ
jgi:O-antigen biosynthesis protein WbqV